MLRRFAVASLAILVSSALLGAPAAAVADSVARPAYLNHDFRKLHETYRKRALVAAGFQSDSFRQEAEDEAATP